MDGNHVVYLFSMLPGEPIDLNVQNAKGNRLGIVRTAANKRNLVIFRFRCLVSCLRTARIRSIGFV